LERPSSPISAAKFNLRGEKKIQRKQKKKKLISCQNEKKEPANYERGGDLKPGSENAKL